MDSTKRLREHIIGLTGNITCGKSLVVEILTGLGAEAIDGDQVAHANMGPHSPLGPALIAEFGPDVLSSDGSVNRQVLGTIVFSQAEKLARLESIAWPPVLATMHAAIARDSPPVLVLDAIKLIEAGIADWCDELWVVTCPRDQQISRIMSRNHVDQVEAERRIDAQPPQSEKVALADVVIDNSGSIERTREQVLAAWARVVGETTGDQRVE